MTTTLRTLSGYAVAVAAAGCIVGGLLHPVVDGEAHSAAALTSPHEALGSTFLLVGTVLLLLGLPGVYAWFAPRLGALGFVGFLMYFLGNLLNAVPHLVLMLFVAPMIARRAPALISEHDMILDGRGFATEQTVFGLVLVGGLLVFSIACLRDPTTPRWIGLLGIVGTVVLFTPIPAHPVISGLQIEPARGVMFAALGLIAARARDVRPQPVAVEA